MCAGKTGTANCYGKNLFADRKILENEVSMFSMCLRGDSNFLP